MVVAAATPAHAELTLAAVERGLPTFCEKPIASTAAESARVAEIIARSGVPVQVGYQRRFDAAFAAAKRAVDDGSLGALHTVRSTTMDPAPPPMDYIKGSGGIFRDCAVHDFDVMRWITGQHAVEVYATGSVQGDPLFTEYGDVDTAAIVVRFDGGALGVVSAARYNGRGYDCRLEVHGFDDTVVAGWDQGAPVRNADPATTFPSGQPHHFFMDRFTEAFRTELSAFVEVVEGGPVRAPPSPTRSRSRGWPKRPPSPCAGASRYRSSRSRSRRVHRSEDRRCTDLVGGVRGTRLGLPARRPTACSPRCARPGLTATELGPEGFLPADTAELTCDCLTRYGSALCRRFRPGGAVQGRPRPGSTTSPGRSSRWSLPEPVSWCWRPRPAPTATTLGRCSTRPNGPRCWPIWTGSPTSSPPAA